MQQERVEGHWRLELPDSETSFRVWRFAVNSSGPSFDQLEVAWRKCNDPGSSLARDNQDDVLDIFSDSCAAIVQPGSGPGPRSLSALRELWVFTTSDAGARVARHNVKNLLELPQIVERLSPSLMVPCPQGHANCGLSCRSMPQTLRLSKNAARREYGAVGLGDDAHDTLLEKVWAILGVAAFDKLAGLNGHRQRPDSTRHCSAILYPTLDSSLILSVSSRKTAGRPRHRPRVLRGSLVKLQPMGYTASYLSNYLCEDTKVRNLAHSLATKLHESRLEFTEWSVFWVPIPFTGADSGCLDRHDGFLAVWPDALVDWMIEEGSQCLSAPPSVSPESSSQLASASAALFEAAWHISATPQSTGTTDSPKADIVGDTGNGDIAMLVADDSDEDLFSVTSSPGADATSILTPAGHESASRPSASEPVESDAIMLTRSASQGARETAIGSITELDFDFFDNPPSPLGEIVASSHSFGEERMGDSPELSAVPFTPLPGQGETSIVLESTELSSKRSREQSSQFTDAGFPHGLPSPLSFGPLDLCHRLHSTRYAPRTTKLTLTDGTPLVNRLRHRLLPPKSQSPSIPSWLDQDRRQAKPQSESIGEHSASTDGTSQNGTSVGLPSPPASPDVCLLAVADPSELRFNGVRCVSIEILDQAAGGGLGADLDICSWAAISSDSKLRGSSATPGAPPSPPSSPETCVKSFRDILNPCISREAIWNRLFPPSDCVRSESRTDCLSIISSLPRPVCLKTLGLPHEDAPPTKVRKRSLSHNKLRPSRFDETFLAPPKIVLGYQGDVILASPESVTFWQELGVSPVAGEKDVHYLVLHFGEGNLALTRKIAHTYESYRLGRHAPASADHVIKTSLHHWRETLVNISKRLAITCSTVIYVLLPKLDHGLLELTTALIGQLSSEERDKTPVVHVIPPWLLDERSAVPAIALDVYNRMRIKESTVASRCRLSSTFEHQVPAFHAVPERATDRHSSLLKLDWPTASHDILRPGSAVHCGYTWLPDEEVLIVVCVDSSGITMSDATRHMPCDAYAPADIIAKIYDFCLAFGQHDRYISICSLQPPPWTHIKAWLSLLNGVEGSAQQVELLCLTQDIRITGTAGIESRPQAPSVSSSSTAQLHAQQFKASVVSLPHRVAVRTAFEPSSPTEKIIFPLASSILLFGPMEEERDIHNVGLHIIATAVNPDYDIQSRRLAIAESYHHLSVLAALRYTGLPNFSLPLHLQAVARVASLRNTNQ